MKPYVMPIVLGDCLMPIQFGYEPLDKKQKLPHLTGEYLKVLQRPLKPGLIEFVSTVIIGTMGYGKTELAKWIAAKVSKFYGAENVNAIMNRSADLEVMLEAMDSRPVQLLFLDDSFGEMPKDIAKQFTRIRHRFKAVLEEAGKPESGIIIALFGIQDIFTLDKLARRVSTATIAKSSSGDKWYTDNLRQIFGKEGVQELDRITRRVTRNYDQGIKGRSVITITGFDKAGYIKNELVDEDLYTEILSPEEDEEEGRGYQDAMEAEAVEASGVELIEAIQQLDFGIFVLAELAEMGVDARNLKIFVRHLDGDSSRDISNDKAIGVTSRQIRRIVEEIKQTKLGYAAERALMIHMGSHQGWVHGGENTDEPDFIDHKNRRVISLKCYGNPDITTGSGRWLAARIGRSEYLTAQRLGYDLQLWVYEMVSKTWYRWRIQQPNPTPAQEPRPGNGPEAPRGENAETQTEDPSTGAGQEDQPPRAQPGPEAQAEAEGKGEGSGVGLFEAGEEQLENGVETCEVWPDPVLMEPVAYFRAMVDVTGQSSPPGP